jgi:hypothetical protein
MVASLQGRGADQYRRHPVDTGVNRLLPAPSGYYQRHPVDTGILRQLRRLFEEQYGRATFFVKERS